jgi:diketogulonate reductase-like aldo/keto reductase
MTGPTSPADAVEAGGAEIPVLGLGTWQNTGEQCAESVATALELGYRHVDTAQAYDNEAEVGEGIERADVDREDVFLTTKVWRSNLAREDVLETVRASVETLGVGYVDLLLVHWPHPRVDAAEPLGALADLRQEGLVDHVGVANYTAVQLEAAVEVADCPLVTDQVMYHPYRDQSRLLSTCREHDVALTAYSPLARGDVLDDEVLAEIGDAHDRSAAQVALRWLLQQDGVVAIPKATGRPHLEANLAVFDFELSPGEMEHIHDRGAGLRRRLKNRLPGVMRRMPL